MINDRGDPNRELKKRKSECMCTLMKLEFFWKHTDNPKKWKIILFNAIIRTKLIYNSMKQQKNN